MTWNKEKALAALLTSNTQQEAADKCGITTRTLRQYLSDPAFADEYKRRKHQVLTDATQQIQASFQSAICTLRGIVESDIASDGAKISAARTLLEFGLRFSELHDVIERLEEIERRVEK